MDDNFFLILVLTSLSIGVLLGWFLGSRPIADWRQRFQARDVEARELDEKFRRAIAELASSTERANRADALGTELASISAERAALSADLATASTRAANAERLAAELPELRASREALGAELAALKANADNFAEQRQLLLAAQDSLKKEFEAAGAKVLEGAQEAFLRRAQERFRESENTNAERIRTLLAPVGERLKSYEDQVSALEAKRIDAFGQLTGLIESMRTGQEQVRAEAARLGSSLRNAPKTRGRWGEQALKNVLEQCGLSEHTDFVTERSVDTDDGRLRPDALVRIPGNKLLVIDAKVSLKDYQDAFDADDERERDSCLDRHVASMRNHVQILASKSYQSQFGEAADFVLMFVPGEHFIAAAIEREAKRRSLQDNAQITSPDLWNYAFERKVLLASPTNLVAIARTVAEVWRQDGFAKDAREIGKLASDLYDSLAKTQDDLVKTGVHLGRAVNSFNDFARTYEGNVLSRARRLTEKHIKIGKREISEDVALIESAPRFAEEPGRLDENGAAEAPDEHQRTTGLEPLARRLVDQAVE